MGLYNFKKQFVPYVLDGSKTHTIRGARRYPDSPGDTCHLFTGLRTKEAWLLLRAPCVRVERFELYRGDMKIWGVSLSLDEKNAFAWKDGFRNPNNNPRGCFDMMLEFWLKSHGTTEFVGQVIHWNFKKAVFK